MGHSRTISRIRFQQLVGLTCVLVAPFVIAACGGDQPDGDGAKTSDSATGSMVAAPAGDPVERGRYLVTVAGCNDCHTPLKMGPNGPEPDMTRMLSGHPADLVMPPAPKLDMPWMAGASATLTAWSGPWGVSFSMNLTPDSVTGIGTWTEEIFMNTLRSGKHWGTSRPIMPPMPWQMIKQMTDDDLKAVYTYLRSIPSIANQTPEYIPPAGGGAAPPPPADTTKM